MLVQKTKTKYSKRDVANVAENVLQILKLFLLNSFSEMRAFMLL